MSDAPRRLLLLVAVFGVTASVLFALRDGSGKYGLFDLLRGRRPPAEAKKTHKREPFTLPDTPLLSADEVPGLARLSLESKYLAERVLPSVVSIVAVETVEDNQGRPKTRDRLGAGVIVSSEGHVMTANHVVYGHSIQGGDPADKKPRVQSIVVRVGDELPLPVELVGLNHRTDIAVLKIITPDKSRKFPALPFVEDSDDVRQGEFVFSFGNPYGLRGTSDFGIISARERNFNDGGADLFQTSTRMLPGHSGGPLVNVFGEIVGINTAIYRGKESDPMWSAVGLATVANEARDMMLAILNRGKPVYGHLGVHVEIPAVYNHLSTFATGVTYPIIVNSVEPGSSAEVAGIQRGDILLEFAGYTFANFKEFKDLVRRRLAGEKVSIVVRRGKQELLLDAVMAERDPQAIFARMEGWTEEKAATFISRSLGAEVSNLSIAKKKSLGLPAAAGGVIVTRVSPRTPAHGRLRVGDIIQICNAVPFQNARQFAKLLEERPGGKVGLLVFREVPNYGRTNMILELEPEHVEPAPAPAPAPDPDPRPTPT